MTFKIRIYYDKRYYRLTVTLIYSDERKERFQITGRNKTIILESNRPLFRNKGVMKLQPSWKLTEGIIHFPEGLNLITAAIMLQLEPIKK